MTTNTRRIRILMFCVSLALLGGVSALALPATGNEEQIGLLTVTGTVTVNGKPAATGDIVASGSQVQTTKGSSAIVSLSKLGRVEVGPSTSMKVIYIDTSTTHNTASFSVLLGDGSARVSTGDELGFFVDCFVQSGLTATRPSLRKGKQVFTVDTTCGNTSVSVEKGQVELRTAKSLKEIAAGSQDTAGQARPGCTPSFNH